MPVVETPLCGPSCLSEVAHTEGLSRHLNGGSEVSAGMTWDTLTEFRDANCNFRTEFYLRDPKSRPSRSLILGFSRVNSSRKMGILGCSKNRPAVSEQTFTEPQCRQG